MNKKSTKKSRLTVNEKNTEKSTLTHLAEAYARTTDEAGKKEIAGEAVTACRGFVTRIIRCHFPTYAKAHAEDMLQEGGTGILEALKGYNPGKARFEVYAAYFVKGQIYSYIANWSGVSRHSMENLSRLNRALAKLSMRGCENPDVGTIAAEMGVSPQVAKNLLRLRRQFENAGEESLADLRCPERDEPERAAEANELSKTLWTAFGKLPFLQRKILRLCYIVEWVKGRKPSDTSVGDRTGMKGHKVSEERESALRTLGRNQKLRKLYLGEEPRSDQELVIEVEPRSRTNAIQTSAEITEIKI